MMSGRDALDHVFVCGMSRSGTTLLTTILDSHPRISMGYEMLPAGLPPAAESAELVRQAVEEAAADAERSPSDLLKQREQTRSLGVFVKRCERTCVEPVALVQIFQSFADQGVSSLESIEMRAKLSLEALKIKRAHEGTSICGCKINAPSIRNFHEALPPSRYVFIVRDPRDVVSSHFHHEFNRTLEEIAHAWWNYTSRFLVFQRECPDQAKVIRYEDLVDAPDALLRDLFAWIGVEWSEKARRFYQSNASVHRVGHLNAESLQRDFFTTSRGRWKNSLDLDQVRAIQAKCGELMTEFGYTVAPLDPLQPLDRAIHKQHTGRCTRAAKFYRNQYGMLVLPSCENRVNLTWVEAAVDQPEPDKAITILRHDVDHDYETALRMGRWEAEHGLRATYCILHTAWYYGTWSDDRQSRSKEMLDCCLELQSMGHEINLHNNLVVLGLKTGQEPVRLLEQELLFLRMHGVNVRGTSTHGDALCRELNFRNYELFSESVYESRGGPRVIEYQGHRVALGNVSMHELGLEYEAYDLPRDLYLTDSGGTLRKRLNTRGRAGLRRGELDPPPPYPHITGILTHPIWWDFEQDGPDEALVAESP